MRLQPLPENVGTERRVSEVVRQRVPGHRTGDGERRRPSVLRRCRCTRRWWRLEDRSRWPLAQRPRVIRRGVAAVHEVLGSPALETPVNCHSELMDDPLRNIEPVQLGVKQKTNVNKFPRPAVPMHCRVWQGDSYDTVMWLLYGHTRRQSVLQGVGAFQWQSAAQRGCRMYAYYTQPRCVDAATATNTSATWVRNKLDLTYVFGLFNITVVWSDEQRCAREKVS